MSDLSDLNPEQRITVALMETMGVPDAAAVVRRDRITAALVGGELKPVLTKLAAELAAIAEIAKSLP